MSNPDFRSPLTRTGIPLGDEASVGLPSLRIEECGFRPRGLDWNFNGVVSPFWRLYWNGAPGSHLVAGGRRIPLRPGTVLLVPEGLRFDTRGRRGTPHLWLHFTVFPHRRYGGDGPTAVRVDRSIRAALEALIGDRKNQAPAFVLYHRSHALLHAVLARFPGFHRPRLPEALERLLEHVQSHLRDDLGNPALAAFSHRSTEGFIRWFGEHLGLPPQQYVSECRVRQAARELAVTDDSIERIAERCGFANRNYFTRVFARATGVPPGLFRSRARSR